MHDHYPQVRLRVRENSMFASRGDTVMATGRDGMVDGTPEHGLFVHQTRMLSRYRIYLAGDRPLLAAGSNARQDRWLGYFIIPAPGGGNGDGNDHAGLPQRAAQDTVELCISRVVGEGMHEDFDITNYARRPVRLRLVLDVDADFADAEETKGERRQVGKLERSWRTEPETWVLRHDYRARHRWQHHGERGSASLHRAIEMRIQHAGSPPKLRGRRVAFDIALEPHARWHACIAWQAEIEGTALRTPDCPLRSGGAEADRTGPPYLQEATSFHAAESGTLAPVVVRALEQARHDLAALRLHRLDHGDRAWTVVAGVPMYVGLFGRDALLAAWQSALAGPEVLRGTLPELARWQGRRIDDWRDEQPGRILHEAHDGPLSVLCLQPKGRYYGSLTSSALYPFAVAQLWNWTADRATVAPLVEPALAALAWLDRVACRHGEFYAYRTRSKQGLDNQTWKDSSDAIVHEDGRVVPQPVASCEEQGTVFAAKTAFAEVLWAFGRKGEARRLHREAQELKRRFNEAYWMDDQGCFAMALDPRGRQVRSIGSNALHCLSTGIADEALVPRVLARLFQPDMFTGWGIRTLSSEHPAYNPYAYHRGTVWPVEHGPFAIGAYRGGFHDRAEQVCRAMFEAADLFDSHRLPECFSGHPRDPAHPFPALYPPANAPQAWSATTGFSLVQALFGLQAYAPAGVLLVDPHLPEWLPQLALRGLRVGDAVVDVRFARNSDGSSGFEVQQLRGPLRVVSRPSPWSLATSFGDGLKALLSA